MCSEYFLIFEKEMSRLLIKNIRQLVSVHNGFPEFQKGKAMATLPCIENAWLACEDGKISDFGSMQEFPGISDWSGLEVIDAEGRCVLPAWADSHTHLVFASWREEEFADRLKGLSYQEIAKRGGGILNSARKLAESTEVDLFDATWERIQQVIKLGTGSIEIKSGYGLSLENELKILRVIARIKSQSPIPVRSTFLGAHAIPAGLTKDEYLKQVIHEMLPAVAAEKLADYCDIFCESGYFNANDTRTLLEAAAKLGIKGKVHAEQLSHTGGTEAGIQAGATSVDHLEYLNDRDINLLQNSKTIPTLLPGAQWFLQLPNPPVRKMIDAGLGVAMASDFNPGSSPSGNMNFMSSIACVQYKMTPEEVINAGTINSAFAMDLQDEVGSISPGKRANLILTEKIPSYSFIPYSFSNPVVSRVIINGKAL